MRQLEICDTDLSNIIVNIIIKFHQVGIYADNLMIALEPEAASLYCMHQPVQRDNENSTFGVFKSGAKYMVVDAGGKHSHF